MKNNKGVSLTELSIVIAIIALLLGAVTAGVSIRKAAEVRNFLTDISTFQNAIEGFSAKYNALPGDMPDAWTYWGGGVNTICGTAAQCNGDNNSQININAADGNDSEAYRAWQHLALSEFIEGSYTGVATVSNIEADIGVNVPASKRTAIGYSIGYGDSGSGLRNEITLGAFKNSAVNTNSSLTGTEAVALDNKMDDGLPSTGLVHGYDGSDSDPSCSAATYTSVVGGCGCKDNSTNTYNTTLGLPACVMTFPIKPQ